MDKRTMDEIYGKNTSLEEKKQLVIDKVEGDAVKSGTEALKIFFDRIPLCSVPGINNVGVVELETSDAIGDAICTLYKQKVLGAPVRDDRLPSSSPMADKYIGLVDFSGMVLWALQELEVAEAQAEVSGLVISQELSENSLRDAAQSEDKERTETELGLGTQYVRSGFFGLLDQLEDVKSTKVGALAQSFRWGPFLPVRPTDTLLHVLLLLSRHKLKAVPVIDADDRLVKGFITQNAAVHLLLQCSGLAWFDDIANKAIHDLRLQSASEILHIYGDDSIMHALGYMWKYRISGVPVVERATKALIGNVRSTDVRILLDNPRLFHQRRMVSVQEYMDTEAECNDSNLLGNDVKEIGASVCAASLSLGNVGLPKMIDPVIAKGDDSLKLVMEKLVHSRSDRCFVVDEKQSIVSVITLRDIINQFAPPLVEPPTQWSGFFETALQLTGSSDDSSWN